jgi:ribosome-binding factor A
VVKVYVSVFGDEKGKELAIAGLKAKAKYVRSELGKRMKLRLTPEIRFVEDESLERGSRVNLFITLSPYSPEHYF